MKSILIPDFTLGKEPTLKSTWKKNEDGLCCYHSCQNKLSNNPPDGIFGFKVCDECKKKDDILKAKMAQEVWMEFIEKVIDYQKFDQNGSI